MSDRKQNDLAKEVLEYTGSYRHDLNIVTTLIASDEPLAAARLMKIVNLYQPGAVNTFIAMTKELISHGIIESAHLGGTTVYAVSLQFRQLYARLGAEVFNTTA